jgi:hypothetical protein
MLNVFRLPLIQLKMFMQNVLFIPQRPLMIVKYMSCVVYHRPAAWRSVEFILEPKQKSKIVERSGAGAKSVPQRTHLVVLV